MIVRRIHLQNFRAHADTTVELPPSGVIAFTGENEAGKSTIATEAILYALFGSAALRGKKQSLRWSRATARRQAEVSIDIELGDRAYTVHRTESDASVWEGPVKVAAGTSIVDGYIPQLLGMGFDEFRATTMCVQKDLARIAGMKPVERRQFFLDVLGVGRIDEALSAVRRRKNELERECAGLATGLGEREPLQVEVDEAVHTAAQLSLEAVDAKQGWNDARAAASNAGDALRLIEQKKQQHEALLVREQTAKTGADVARKEFERVRSVIADAMAAYARTEVADVELADLPALRTEAEQLRAAVQGETARKQLSDALARLDTEIRQTDGRIAEMQRAVKAFDAEAYEVDVDLLKEMRQEAETALQARRDEQVRTKSEIDTATAEAQRTERKIKAIEQAGAAGDCPTCQRALDQQYGIVLDNLRTARESLLNDVRKAEARLRELQTPLPVNHTVSEVEGRVTQGSEQSTSAQVASRQLAVEMPRLDRLMQERTRTDDALRAVPAAAVDPARAQVVTAAIRKLEELDRATAADRAKAGHLPELERDLAFREGVQIGANEAVDAATRELLALAFDLSEYEAARLLSRQADERCIQTSHVAITADADARAAGERAVRAERLLTDYDTRANHLTQMRIDLGNHVRADERLTAFRAATAATIRPELEELVSGFMSVLTDGRHEAVSIDEEFNVVAYEAGVPVPVVSGGCEDLIALSLRIAISQMIAERANSPISLIVLDEPLGALSEVRRGNVLALLHRLRNVFVQVILITHVDAIKHACGHVFHVEYDEAAGHSIVTTAQALGSATDAAA